MPTKEELKDRLRRDLGNLSLTDLTDEQAGDAVQSAINEYSKHKPIVALDFIATQKDQPLYSLSDRIGIIRVKDVYYCISSVFSYTFENLWPDIADIGRLEGISVFENPSIWLQYIQRLEQYKAIFEGTYDYDRITKMLRLIPAPTATGNKVFFTWTKPHTTGTIPEEEIDTMLLWAKGEAKEKMAGKKSTDIQSVSGYGESVTFGATSESLMKEANDYRTRFEKKFKGGSILIVG